MWSRFEAGGFWSLVMAATVSSLVELDTESEVAAALSCHHPSCQYIEEDSIVYHLGGDYVYDIEGTTIKIFYERLNQILRVDCNGTSVLESPAMPRANTELPASFVTLENCSLPVNSSLVDALAILNFTICQHNSPMETCSLELLNLLTEPPLNVKHFVGLEHLKTLLIHNEHTRTRAESGFLAPLLRLRALRIFKVELLAGELDALPPLLDTLFLRFTDIKRLSKAVYSSTKLRELVINDNISFDAVKVPPEVRTLELQSTSTMLQLDVAPALEALLLNNWAELLPPKLTSCAMLQLMHLQAPAMRHLPYEWLSNCPRLEELKISEAHNLMILPPKLFSSSSQLKHLTLRRSALEEWPGELLSETHSLEILELDNNRLKIIPRSSFSILHSMSKLNLSRNDLDNSVIDVEIVVSIYGAGALTELDFSYNPRIEDLCGAGGHSALDHRTGLRKLDFSGTGVSIICTDWKEEMPGLELLNLSNTKVAELTVEDLQYTRRVEAQVDLRGAPITAVRVTREDYNQAVQASPSFTSMHIDAEVECDCSMYWARRVLDHPLAKHTLPGISEIRCIGGGLLGDVALEDLVCSVRDVSAIATLPAGCECVARPDDDPAQERWLVKVRCQNSLNFVPRRIYPFYPLFQSNNQGFYTLSVNSLEPDY